MKMLEAQNSMSGFRRIDSTVWRKTEGVSGQVVDFDIRTDEPFTREIQEIEKFFGQVKASEPAYRSLIAQDFVRDDAWSTWCGIENPGQEALCDSMQLRWVIATTDKSSRWGYILVYDSLLPNAYELSGWFDAQGHFMHAEVE
ncbi:hypothetical protein [Deinococcus aquaedulcis]|uniref:hypothetical protein n=1 Tax=Deinococcus aquaedulcis TaxID=2840455 RepID=UPI001C82B8F7|nr:hypothetical protein [Deinococcus aquaedulcis]